MSIPRNFLVFRRCLKVCFAKRYGFHTVHDFYKGYASSKEAYAEYRDKADKWEETYGENT